MAGSVTLSVSTWQQPVPPPPGPGRAAVLRASIDDFKRPWAERHLYDRFTGEGYYRNAYDHEAVRRLLLEPAAPDGDGVVALCSIDPITQIRHERTIVQMPADGVLIVDGLFTLRPELAAFWECAVWIDVESELSVERGVARDAHRDGLEEAAMLHRNRYGKALALYLAEADPVAQAHIVIDNSDFTTPVVLQGDW